MSGVLPLGQSNVMFYAHRSRDEQMHQRIVDGRAHLHETDTAAIFGRSAVWIEDEGRLEGVCPSCGDCGASFSVAYPFVAQEPLNDTYRGE